MLSARLQMTGCGRLFAGGVQQLQRYARDQRSFKDGRVSMVMFFYPDADNLSSGRQNMTEADEEKSTAGKISSVSHSCTSDRKGGDKDCAALTLGNPSDHVKLRG